MGPVVAPDHPVVGGIELLDDFPEARAINLNHGRLAEGSAPWRRLGGFLEPDPEKKGCSAVRSPFCLDDFFSA